MESNFSLITTSVIYAVAMKKLANPFSFIKTEAQGQLQFISDWTWQDSALQQSSFKLCLSVSLKLQEMRKSYAPRKSNHHHNMQATETVFFTMLIKDVVLFFVYSITKLLLDQYKF